MNHLVCSYNLSFGKVKNHKDQKLKICKTFNVCYKMWSYIKTKQGYKVWSYGKEMPEKFRAGIQLSPSALFFLSIAFSELIQVVVSVLKEMGTNTKKLIF